MTGTPEPPPATTVVSQRIAEQLAARILAGELPPGARIKQDELAEQLRTSRLPVREALRILQSRGLVTLRANAGAWVARLERRDLEISYKVREQIEPLLLMESLPHLTAEDVERMRGLQAEISANEDVERFLVLDRAFHWASYAGARAPELVGMVERLWDTTQSYRREFSRLAGRDRAWVINAEHDLLLEAVARGDGVNASTVLTMHIRRTRLELAGHPELFADGAG